MIFFPITSNVAHFEQLEAFPVIYLHQIPFKKIKIKLEVFKLILKGHIFIYVQILRWITLNL